MERDRLSEEAARKRMEAQMTNAEYVHRANVVFSTQWEPEYTQKQVICSAVMVLAWLQVVSCPVIHAHRRRRT